MAYNEKRCSRVCKILLLLLTMLKEEELGVQSSSAGQLHFQIIFDTLFWTVTEDVTRVSIQTSERIASRRMRFYNSDSRTDSGYRNIVFRSRDIKHFESPSLALFHQGPLFY